MSEGKKAFRPNKITMLTILLSSMVILMGAAAVAPALEPISQHFSGQSEFMISLIITLPALSVAITGFGMGYLADRFGKAKILMLSLVIFTAAGAVTYCLDNFMLILAARFILGIGITGISSTTTALISEYWSGPSRLKVIGYQSAAIGVGTLVLEFLGGTLADIGWQEPFLIYLIGVPILVCALLSVREPRREAQGGAVIEAVIPRRGRKIAYAYAMVFLEMFLMFSLPTNMSYYVSEIGQDLAMCGLLLGLMGVAQAVVSLIYSRTSNKMTEDRTYALAFLAMGAGLALLCVPNLAVMFLSMAVVGFSLGLLMPTVIGQLSRLSTVKTSGKVMGGYSVALNFSTFVSGLTVTMLHSALGTFAATYLLLGGASAVIFVLCLVKPLFGQKAPVSGIPPLVTVTHEPPSPAAVPADDGRLYGTILVPTDGSEYSNFAVRKAIRIAKQNGSAVTALFVVDTERYAGLADGRSSAERIREDGKRLSDEALSFVTEEGLKNGLKVTTTVKFGRPVEEIVNESKDYDLVVCGSLGRTNLSRALIGSVAEKVARMAYCPVLICRKNEQGSTKA